MSKECSIIRSFSQIICRAAACLVALFIFTAMAGAANYTVDTSSDDGGLSACTAAANDCSLRGAISRANATPDPDVITFGGSYTIIMTGFDFIIHDAATAGALTITNSTGASNLVIDANYIESSHLARGFRIQAGGNLTLNGVTVRNGYSFRVGGGGILNEGTLLLTNSIVSGNVAEDDTVGTPGTVANEGGGGIYNKLGATMTIEHSTVTGNSGFNGGGGIYNGGTLTLTNSTVSGNSVPDLGFLRLFRVSCIGGGGICNVGTLNLTNSTVSNNSCILGGGGIFNQGINSTANIANSVVVNNSSGDYPIGQLGGGGGGISNFIGTLNLINVTVGNNSVTSSGGGIANFNGNVFLINVTVANNGAIVAGGGIASVSLFDVPTSVSLINTIVAKNSAPAAPDYEGIVEAGSGYNLIGDGTGMSGVVNGSLGNQVGASAASAIDPKLNSNLALNGGTTLNFALLTGSPAIDKGFSIPNYDNGTDQRGLIRPSDNPNIPNAPGGNGADIGAFEVQVPPSFDLTVTKTHTGNFPQGSAGNTYTITVTNNGPAATIGTVSVVDTLPTGLTATDMTGTGWTCTLLPELKCTRSDALAAGASYPEITLTVDVALNAPASVINNVSVSGSGGDSNPANNTASDPTTIGKPDLTVYKTHNGVFPQGSSGNTYTINVTNSGDAGAPTIGTVSVVDTLPTGLTATDMTGTGWTCTLLPELKCTRIDTLAVGGFYPPIILTVDVAANAPASVINNVSVSGGGDSNPANNTASDPTTIDGVFDLTVTKTHPGNFTQGGVGTYTITARNSGTGAYIGTILVIDTLPLGLTLRSLPVGTGWNCAMDDVAKAFSCDRTGLLAAGARYPPITATVDVASSAPASVINTVRVAGNNEIDRTNNTASDPTTIIALPGYSLSGTVSYGIADANQLFPVVSGANLNATGTASVSAVSDVSGSYQLSNLLGGNYMVTPSKTGDVRGIDSTDATRIQQHLVGMTTLTANQMIAADTDGSGTVNSLDATRIQQRAVGMQTQNVIGQWKFVPGSRQYNALGGNATGQDYQAVLVGEVSGNWATASSFAENSAAKDEELLPTTDAQIAERFAGNLFSTEIFANDLLGRSAEETNQSSDSSTNESTTEMLSPAADIQVSLPADAMRSAGATVTIPITIGAIPAGQSIESFDFSLFYNPAVLQPAMTAGSNTETLSGNCSVLPFSPLSGRVIVSGACAQGITTGSGVLYNLTFNVIGAINQTSGLSFINPANNANTFQFANGTPTVATANGQFTVLAPTAANISIGGRILTPEGGGLRNAVVYLTKPDGTVVSTRSTSFGYYRFETLEAGEIYTIAVKSKLYAFEPRLVLAMDNLTDIDLTAFE